MVERNNNIWAYIAGFIDGEGTISIRKQQGYKSKKGKVSIRLRPFIVMTNTDMKVIEYIRERLNEADIKTGLSIHRKEHRKDCYQLYVQKFSRITKLLDLVQPFLITKQENAVNIRAFMKLRQGKLQINRTAPHGKEEKELCNIIRFKKIV